jgi:hypothetical protein
MRLSKVFAALNLDDFHRVYIAVDTYGDTKYYDKKNLGWTASRAILPTTT